MRRSNRQERETRGCPEMLRYTTYNKSTIGPLLRKNNASSLLWPTQTQESERASEPVHERNTRTLVWKK